MLATKVRELTIMVPIDSGVVVKHVPVLFVLMSRRRTIDYKAIFVFLFEYIFRQTGKMPVVTSIKLDFELALWNCLRALRENNNAYIEIKGCFFHFCQVYFP